MTFDEGIPMFKKVIFVILATAYAYPRFIRQKRQVPVNIEDHASNGRQASVNSDGCLRRIF